MRDFICSQHILNFCVCDDEGAYAANCFYAFDDKELALIIKSSAKSKHISLAQKNPKIAITIAVDTKKLFLIRGIQAKAIIEDSKDSQIEIYYQSYPFARFIDGEFYTLKIYWAKYTDNSFLGKKKLEFYRKVD
ncbi:MULTISPECIES: hypothetical protein [unclassified Helicobacter]|uniref:hypothetical protein n=1 Tax=unclassified Helicobacter TaxID=2593540 RepID=UPI001F414413|nr:MULTISPECIES: hypothetical protein [unclassified Helicobacter]